jgi:hypothetical protein
MVLVRPCKRCVNRGTADQCVDSVSDRKRGKRSNKTSQKKAKPNEQTNTALDDPPQGSPTTSPSTPKVDLYAVPTISDPNVVQHLDTDLQIPVDLPSELRNIFHELFGSEMQSDHGLDIFNKQMQKAKRKLLVAFSEEEADEVVLFSILIY